MEATLPSQRPIASPPPETHTSTLRSPAPLAQTTIQYAGAPPRRAASNDSPVQSLQTIAIARVVDPILKNPTKIPKMPTARPEVTALLADPDLLRSGIKHWISKLGPLFPESLQDNNLTPWQISFREVISTYCDFSDSCHNPTAFCTAAEALSQNNVEPWRVLVLSIAQEEVSIQFYNTIDRAKMHPLQLCINNNRLILDCIIKELVLLYNDAILPHFLEHLTVKQLLALSSFVHDHRIDANSHNHLGLETPSQDVMQAIVDYIHKTAYTTRCNLYYDFVKSLITSIDTLKKHQDGVDPDSKANQIALSRIVTNYYYAYRYYQLCGQTTDTYLNSELRDLTGNRCTQIDDSLIENILQNPLENLDDQERALVIARHGAASHYIAQAKSKLTEIINTTEPSFSLTV